MRTLSKSIHLLTLLAACGAAHAGTFYTDLASFTAAIDPGYYLETFNTRPRLTADPAPVSFAGSGFSYTAAPGSGGFYNEGSVSDVWLSTDGTETLNYTFTSGNIKAVGGYFFATGSPGNPTSATVTLTFSDGGTVALTNPNNSTFTGYISSSVLTSLLQAPSGVGNLYSTANDLYVGVPATAAAVPEPSAFLLSAAGLGLLFRRLRRNR
jgi:hypothetical protein